MVIKTIDQLRDRDVSEYAVIIDTSRTAKTDLDL
jgi:hypothetical protein